MRFLYPHRPVPPVPPVLAPGRPAIDDLRRGAILMMSCLVPVAVIPSAAFLLPDPWRTLGIWGGGSVGVILVARSLLALSASSETTEREHRAGYTTIFGGGTRYWQLEPGTGKVLRRPGERTVHREGIPRELLAQEAAARVSASGESGGASVGPDRCPACGYPDLAAPPRGPDGRGSGELCPSCGFAFGVSDDALGYTVDAWRARWCAQGRPWSGGPHQPPPPDWDPAAQLRRLEEAG